MTYLVDHPLEIATLTGQHLLLTLTSLLIAFVIALPLGVAVARTRAGGAMLAILGAIYTIPSLAMLAFFVGLFGLGTLPAIIALTAYAQMILVRNVAAGLGAVDRAQLEAADGIGFSPLGRLMRIELPQAVPAIVGGVRVATVSLISVATVASYVHAGGLGTLLFDGIHQDYPQKIVAGSVAAAALAIVADVALRAIERAVGGGRVSAR